MAIVRRCTDLSFVNNTSCWNSLSACFYLFLHRWEGICFCTSATFCSLGMGLKDLHFPKVYKQQHVLSSTVQLCWRCCPSLVFLRAGGREAQYPGELCMCDFWIWIAPAGVFIQEASDDHMPNVNASYLVDWDETYNMQWILQDNWGYSCGAILPSLSSVKRKPKAVSCHCLLRWWKWGFDYRRFLVQVCFCSGSLMSV